MAEQKPIAYCVKCRQQREILSPEAVYTQSGAPGTRGVCPVCGTRLFKMGRTEAHASIPKPQPKPQKVAKYNSASDASLVIVESPAKAWTVGRFLGRGYTVKASVGHVRDLPRSTLGVEVENNFAPRYLIPKQKRKVVSELQDAAAKAGDIYLATDPDREGEAIAWHLVEALQLDPVRYHRVAFHEITLSAVKEAFAHARKIDMDLVNAQQARRVLDRLVGYKISPLLWRKVRSRLSAGRVQSVALRLVVEREREIQAFVPEEYWSIEAELAKREVEPKEERRSFIAALVAIDGEKADLKNETDTHAIVRELENATYIVTSVKESQRRRNPPAPFTTSTMQQEAGRRLRFTAKRTMAVAQGLYEGVDVGEGRVGLITYMRTDSVNVSAEAQREARDYILKTYGETCLPSSPPQYKTRAKKAQEAHEAIRPTSVFRTPADVKPYLQPDQFRLYDLIWRRFVASQMEAAVYDTAVVEVKAGLPERSLSIPVGETLPEQMMRELVDLWRYLFRATGSVLRFPGFLQAYADQRGEEEKETKIPELARGEIVDLLHLIPDQHFTEPPPRYTEATLVRALEEHGIGRPSTYAPILTTIQSRGYVTREGQALTPTELGFAVTDLLVEHFPAVMDYDFTAHMEEDLDRIAEGDRDWVQVLRDFYGPFAAAVRSAEKNMPKVEIEAEDPGLTCPQCGHKMVVKWGRYGKFIACSNYPACRHTQPYTTGVKCPQCGGDLLERRSKRGRIFYGCSNYPKCGFVAWGRPVPEPCPACGGLLTETGRRGLKCVKCGQTIAILETVAPTQRKT